MQKLIKFTDPITERITPGVLLFIIQIILRYNKVLLNLSLLKI